ncbi:MAG: group II intron reverse transcriptase domain-containing protein [Xanthomonadales bacterium]|nr:group II intron reverse transcriptase domain-containing protein [Xanthomonadales bacterium]
MSLRDALQDPDLLAGAYARLARRPGLWMQGVPMSQVRSAPVRAMLHLAQSLREGSYRAQRPAVVSIAKADGTLRELSIYGLRDRLVQRALLDLLQPLSEPRFSNASFGFRPGRSVAMAVRRAQRWIDCGHHWLVDADIERCFDSIPRRQLLDVVGEWLDDADAPGLVASCLGWRSDDIGADARGIPQGACLSPWLCNVFLHRLDVRSRRCRAPLVRYADDFLLFARARRGAEQLKLRCGRWLAALGLALHPRKTQIVDACTPIRFLGRELVACC